MMASAAFLADTRIGKEGGGDDDAVAEVVDAVAEDDAPAATPGLPPIETAMMMVLVAFVVMAVPVELGFLEQEEEHQAAEQRAEQGLRAGLALESLGQDAEQRRREKHAGRQAHEVLDDARQQRDREACCNGDRQHAAGELRENDPAERHATPLARNQSRQRCQPSAAAAGS